MEWLVLRFGRTKTGIGLEVSFVLSVLVPLSGFVVDGRSNIRMSIRPKPRTRPRIIWGGAFCWVAPCFKLGLQIEAFNVLLCNTNINARPSPGVIKEWLGFHITSTHHKIIYIPKYWAGLNY